MVGGQTHVYTFSLEKDQFADLIVDQRGIDVAVRLYGPDGSLLTSVDSYSLDGTRGPEPVPVVAETGGPYRLEIRPSDPKAATGRYAVLFQAVRPAAARDRARTAAERTLAAGQALRQRGDSASRHRAVAKHEEALAGFRALGDRGRQADVLRNLGELHRELGEPPAALAAYQEAVPLFRELGRRRETADALRGLGIAQVALGDTDTAFRNYREALAMEQALGDRSAEADLLSNMARAYTVLGKMEKALDVYEQELALRQELGQPADQGWCLINLGRIYALVGDDQRAIDYFTRGRPLVQAGGRRLEAVGALDDLGKALVRTGRTQEGITAIEQSLRLQRQMGNRAGEAVALSDLGAVYESLGRREAALRSYGLALPILHERGERLREATVLSNLGRLQEEAGDLRGATGSYFRTLRLSEASGRRSDQAAALLGLARVRRRQGDLPGARQAAESARDRIEALRVETVSPELRASFLATKQEYYQFHVDLLMELDRREPAAGYDARAFEASELARARSLLDALAQARAGLRSGIDPRLLAREADLGDRVNAAERLRLTLVENGAPAPRIEAAERELRELLGQSERLRDRIRRASPRYAALSQAHPASLQAIQEALDPDTLLLEYALGRERSYLWAVTRTSVASFERPPQAAIEEAAREALFRLGSSQQILAPAQTGAVLARLSHLLLDPVAGQLRKRLVIVGDGSLHALPFAALPIPGRGDVPLIAEHEVLSLPSASTLVALRREPARPRSAMTVAVLADPVLGAADPRVTPGSAGAPASLRRPDHGRLERLPFARKEAEAILALAPRDRTLGALGLAASRQTVMSGRLEPYGIVHFATHGVLDSRYPELSGIALSDGFLRVHDIYRLNLPADLVVLSACETALGQEVRGEGLIGLTRAFFSAGARRVLVSLWPVEDRATAELMRRFYREMLQNGLPASAALRAAQDSLRKEPGWQAPYYWAGFVLQGDWRR